MDTCKNCSNKLSTKIRKKYDKYKADLSDAFDIGYASGWETSFEVPDCMLGKIHAALGFKKGLRDRRRVENYTKRYKKKGKK